MPILWNYYGLKQGAELVREFLAGGFNRHWRKRGKCSFFDTPLYQICFSRLRIL